MPKLRRDRALGALLAVLEDLMRGAPQDWRTVAKACDVKRPAADRRLRLLARLPGATLESDGTSRGVRLVFGRVPADRPRLSVVYAACLAASLSRMFKGSAHEQNVRQVRETLLGRAESPDFGDLDRKFFFASGGGEHGFPELAEDLDDVLKALLETKSISFSYIHFDGRAEERIVVEPLSLGIHEHQFYVIARRVGDTAPYPFRFARLSSVEIGEPFVYPTKSAYDPEQLFRDSIGIFVTENFEVVNVTVRLSPVWVTYANAHRWHMSQRIEAQHDGSVLVHLRVRQCPELERWVLGFGDGAIVIRPEALRARVATRLGAAAAGYRERARARKGASPGPGVVGAHPFRRAKKPSVEPQPTGARRVR